MNVSSLPIAELTYCKTIANANPGKKGVTRMDKPAAAGSVAPLLGTVIRHLPQWALLVAVAWTMTVAVTVEAQSTGTVIAIVRDFSSSHPDFLRGGITRTDENIVGPRLGADGTPVYAGGRNGTATTSGPIPFFDWYHDTDSNIRFRIDLDTGISNGYRTFDPGDQFLPIDGRGFGNQGEQHNFLFTTAIHLTFTYWQQRPEVVVQCDDDCFVYVNGDLVVNGGGIHSTIEYRVDLNALAEQLDLVEGEAYPVDIFHAERNPDRSLLRFRVPRLDSQIEPPTSLGGTVSGMHIDALTVTCLNATTGARADYITVDPVFSCKDFGFPSQPGDQVIINILGNGIAK